MRIEGKLYTERFIHSQVPYKNDEENIFIQYYFDSVWRGGYQTSSSTENPHSIISLVTGGDVICTDPDGKTLHIPENTLYVITAAKKGYSYKVPKNTFWQRKSVRFRRNALFDLLTNRFFQKDHLVIPLKNPEKIGMIMDEFRDILEKNPMATSEISGLFMRLLCEIRSGQDLQHTPEALRNALDYIQLHYKNPSLSRQEIASAAGISTRTLNRFFMEYRKDTPGNIVSSLRLEYAKSLLERSLLTVKEIALESGFRSANFLTRRFRLRYDLTPLEYRRKHFTGGKL